MKRLWNWLSVVGMYQEQVDELHGRIRVLEADNEAIKRINNRIAEELFEAREMLLEHSYHCIPSWGESK